MDGLKALKKSRVSTKLLADTQAGKRVKSLTKHPKAALAAAAAEVVATWKEVVKKEAAASSGGSTAAAVAAAAASGATSGASGGGLLARAGSQATVEDAPASQRSSSQALGSQAAGGPPLDLDAVPRCGDSLRDKCRQNLAAAMNLAVGGGAIVGLAWGRVLLGRGRRCPAPKGHVFPACCWHSCCCSMQPLSVLPCREAAAFRAQFLWGCN